MGAKRGISIGGRNWHTTWNKCDETLRDVSGHMILLGQAYQGACDGGRRVGKKNIKASRTLTGKHLGKRTSTRPRTRWEN